MAKKTVKKAKKVEKSTLTVDDKIFNAFSMLDTEVGDIRAKIHQINQRIDRIVAAITTAKPITKDM